MAMMHGYDKAEALAYILQRINPKEHPALADRIEDLISQAIDADMQYMHEAGVLDANGNAGGSYYEDDDAIEYMTAKLVKANKLNAVQAVKLVALLDDYLDFEEQYLEGKGLVDWD